uniref:Uncharacterized protein n=1 Tax=Opuntia streptacantha TaxID=393608 RepID=A0A7C8ZEL4_OPUST
MGWNKAVMRRAMVQGGKQHFNAISVQISLPCRTFPCSSSFSWPLLLLHCPSSLSLCPSPRHCRLTPSVHHCSRRPSPEVHRRQSPPGRADGTPPATPSLLPLLRLCSPRTQPLRRPSPPLHSSPADP